MTARPTIECWFDFASSYSYLSVMRIERDAAALGVQVLWRPLLLGPVLQAQGWPMPPFVQQPAKARYMWTHDLPRQCRKRGLPVVASPPRAFPRSALLPLRVALLGADQQADWVGEFCRRLIAANFVGDQEIESPDLVKAVLACLGLPAAALIDAAQTPEHKQRLRDQTAHAQARGVFGAPTFFVGDEMFWGDDRLDDALARAAGQS